MTTDIAPLTLTEANTLRDALRCLDRTGKGIALVLDVAGRLRWTLTDGDLRRAVLHGTPLDAGIGAWLEGASAAGRPAPITALRDTPPTSSWP